MRRLLVGVLASVLVLFVVSVFAAGTTGPGNKRVTAPTGATGVTGPTGATGATGAAGVAGVVTTAHTGAVIYSDATAATDDTGTLVCATVTGHTACVTTYLPDGTNTDCSNDYNTGSPVPFYAVCR